MPISRFASDLIQQLDQGRVPAGLVKEQDLEQKFVLPIAERLAAQHPDVLLYVHPWGRKRRCDPDCATLPPGESGRIIGCPKCWEVSKKAWASVAAFDSHHTFDLAAIDGSGKTLAVELKLSKPGKGHLPSGDVQRFLGQCALASTKHTVVVGYFVYYGELDGKWQGDPATAKKWFEDRDIHLVFRSA